MIHHHSPPESPSLQAERGTKVIKIAKGTEYPMSKERKYDLPEYLIDYAAYVVLPF